ncbi:transcription antitermination factor NusB [Alkanindiges illinoisensis]|uniref:Transcription antitermination protein NusB n=1 Tax=Alkanindiges illinoisensis TaxID=197183 RepID=A0A4Y7XB72_9GAMM|nr:transcription antitermination factor NusB [Alkanindiges illinoisensis]TEU25563.1 transcription antitermination factor NusB [Alkanindiges illinoisensis]
MSEQQDSFKYPTTFAAKRKARRFALQGLYEWQMTHNPVHEIEARTRAENAMHKVDIGYYHQLLTQVIQHTTALDELIKPLIDRDLSALDGVELAALRLGAFELRDRLEVPYRVVIDEAIELAKHFGATDSHKYVNGVLDRLAQQLRAAEKNQ